MPIKKGQVLNPRGNPNIAEISKECSTGPKTNEGKLRSLLSSKRLRPWSKSKVLSKFNKCDKCPLRAQVVEHLIKVNLVNVQIPSSCSLYEKGNKCRVSQGDFIEKLGLFFSIAKEQGTLELQKALTFGMLENSEIAKQTSLLKHRTPGFEAAKFQELASKNLEVVNKLKYGEKQLIAMADVTKKISAEEAIEEFEKDEKKKRE